MNRKDLEALARVVRTLAGERNGGQSKETVAEVLAAALVPPDGRTKFLRACGVAHEPS